jgi:hypothetical protein
MTKIFDGTSLMGWDGNPAIWSVNAADMALEGKTTNGGQLIKTVATYDDFRLVVTERMVATNNHLGECFWGTPSMPMAWGYNGCIDLIAPAGSLWDYGGGGGVYSGSGNNAIRLQWHQVEILALASTGQILAAVDGKQTTTYTRPKGSTKGPIGLQAHAGASDEEYKDIWVEPSPQTRMLVTVH